MFAHPKMAYTYIGADSHKNSHTLVVMDCFHEKLGEITIGNAPSEFDDFLKKAQQYKLDGTSLVFGMEDVSAFGRLLAKFLINKNQLVKHVDSSLVASERNAKNIVNKTDSEDAECAGRVLVNRFDKLPNANVDDRFWILSGLVARHNSLVKINNMIKNHLHSLLCDNYPSYKSFFSEIDGNTALAFYEHYPSPHLLENVTLEEFTQIIKELSKGLLKEKKAKLILDAVQNDGCTKCDYQASRDFTIVSIVKQLKGNKEQIKLVDDEIKSFLVHFNYPLTSIKGIDTLTCAKIIAEVGDISRFKNAGALAKYAGVAPVTHASGMSAVEYANERGNRKLSEIFFRLAVASALPVGKERILLNPIFHEYYTKKISEGKTKKQALKSVQRRLVNIVFRVMKDGTEYINPPMAKAEKKSS